jgi:dipeptidyl aminopeptidase/acylaminoacyl peptidase
MHGHRFSLAVCALSLALASCTLAPQDPATPSIQTPRYTIEQFLSTVSYSGASFSPDNSKILVSSDMSGIFNVYSIPVGDGEPVALTESTTESIFARGYFPADERFLYSSDEGGDELTHIYVREVDGSIVDVTPGEGHKASFYGWARDDASFFVGTNERDQRFFDVYEVSAMTYERELLYTNDEGLYFADITADRNTLALTKVHTRNNSDIYLYHRDREELEHLTPHEGDINHNPQMFSVDGSELYFLTDLDSEYRYLVAHDLAMSTRREVVRAEADVWYAYLSKSGKYLVAGVDDDASLDLRLHELPSMARVPMPPLPKGEPSSVSLSADDSRMAIYLSSSRIPRDLFYHELGTGDARRLTTSLTTQIESQHLVDGQVVRFASFDGLEVPGILYRPHDASVDSPAPALVWVHGGPGGQSRLGYDGLIQYLVNHGYVVYAINNRGSSGYGKTFEALDNQKHGEGDLDDCVESRTMLVETGYVDADRIGILGGSYGGYMTLAALTFRPEAFAVGVDLFGISNWHRTLQNIPPWWEAFRASLEKEMGDFDDEEYHKSISPLFHSEQIVRPLMVLQGANDPRVLQIESDEIVEAVKANGVPVEYIVFDDEGHGFAKKKNRIAGFRAIREFLDLHLRDKE